MDAWKILVVDDEQHNLQMLLSYLQEMPSPQPCQLLAAPNGQVAYNIILERKPDLVITDWEMPVMNGLVLLQTLKVDPATRDIPVLMVTGIHLGGEGLQTALEAGAMDYIRKPVEKVELWARVNSAIRLMQSYHRIQDQSQRIQEQSELLGQQKDRELSVKLMELQQKGRELLNLRKSLEDILPKADGELKGELATVVKQLGSSTDPMTEWDAFRQHFEKVHPRFLNYLRQQHPKLTVDDLRYCAYLRLNLSNHDIAQLLHIAQDSVRTHKHRLKKRLELPADQDLGEYLTGITATE